jgi:hypothetical protein
LHPPRPSYTLPLRSITSVSHTSNQNDIPAPLLDASLYNAIPKSKKEIAALRRASPPNLPPTEPLPSLTPSKELNLHVRRTVPLAPVSKATDTTLNPSIQALLPLLKAQPPHYITIHIHNKPFLVTLGDKITLPFRILGLSPGDVLRLNRASLLGSRDYTLKSGFVARRTKDDAALGVKPRRETWIDERLFLCRAVVLGEEVEPERVKEKTKQRQRRVKRVRSQHTYTVLRISELKVLGPEVLEGRPEEGDIDAVERNIAAVERDIAAVEREGLVGRVGGESGVSGKGDVGEKKIDNAKELVARIKAVSGKKVVAGSKKEAQEDVRKLESILEDHGL